jgi:hypothetical protein
VYTPAAGTVLQAGRQTLRVTFTPTDALNYTAATAGVTLVVTQATPKLGWTTPAAIVYGTALSSKQLNATSTVAGTFSYSPAAGTVPHAGQQTLNATFTPSDATDYATTTVSVTLVVTQATPKLGWTTPAAIVYGTALSGKQLNATSSVAGAFSYSQAAGTVLRAGKHALTATFSPTDTMDYTTAGVGVSIEVTQATPKLSWTAPAAIVYGTALSSKQLNATSSVAGTFSYSPAAGTVLTLGKHTLTATFTPKDAMDYTSATATVAIDVLKQAATPTFTPVAGSYTGTQQVSIQDTTAGAAIYYTTDNTAPTAKSTKYTQPVAVTKSETIKAIAVATGYADSAVAKAAYTIE